MTDNTAFVPIKGSADSWSWSDREEGVRVLNHENKQAMTDLLMGRKVVKADKEHLVLDNGTVVKAIGHDGGCGCNAGCYDLSVLNSVDNVITKVEFDYAPGEDWEDARRTGHPDDPEDAGTGYYRVFVYADNQQINLMQFDGTDGNGYYGTGFEILVRGRGMTDFPTLVKYLRRTAQNASYTMTVDRSMVLKLLSAADLAEAVLAHNTLVDGRCGLDDISEAAERIDATEAAYRKATGR